MEQYAYLHTVRVGVEIVLYYLFIYSLIPESMTFSGRNFDILAGLTAPFVAYYGYNKGKLSDTFLLVWNWVCLILVSQVVITGILSAPTPFQQLSLNEPNTGILYFPFVLVAWYSCSACYVRSYGGYQEIKSKEEKVSYNIIY